MNVTTELLLALDLGTTGVRSVLVDAGGEVRARAYRRLPTAFPAPGHVEQDPAQLWRLALETLREALEQAKTDARSVAALGVVTQRATALAWDVESGEPLAPALGWQDQRAADLVARLRAEGLPLSTQPSLSKWLWWLERDPAVREAAARGRLRLGTPDAWLTDRLTGGRVFVTDPSQASCTALYDLSAGDWAQPLLESLRLDPGFFPRVVPTSAVAGDTDPRWLGAGIPVAARAGDQQAAAFAAGVLAPGEAKLTLGTAAMLDLHTGGELRPPPPGCFPLVLWRLADGRDVYCLEGSVWCAGAALDWAVQVGLLDDATQADGAARGVESSEGALFVPALQGLGAPFADEAARGLLGGLTRGSTRGHLVRALLEGIAHRCVDVGETLLPPEAPVPVDGGLARSDFLLQSLADFSGREWHRAAETETTALGGAWLAALAAGILENPEAVAKLRAVPTVFAPRLDPDGRATARARWREAVRRARS